MYRFKQNVFALFLLSIADDVKAEIVTSLVIDIAPWGMLVSDLPSGIYARIAEEINGNIPGPKHVEVMPYSRVQVSLADLDHAYSIMSDSKEVRKYALPVTKLFDLEVQILLRRGIDISGLEDLVGKTVAKVQGTHLSPAMEAKQGITLIEVPNTIQQLKMLAKGRVDAIIGVREDFLYAERFISGPEMGIQSFSPGQEFFIRKLPIYVWASKTSMDTDFYYHLQRAATAFVKSNTKDAIVREFLRTGLQTEGN